MAEIDKILKNLSTGELRFWVSGVYCNNCVSRIHRALKTISGVENVEIKPDFKELRALVILKFKGEVSKKDIEEVLSEASDETPYHEYKPIWE
ncbi:heavy-metal-associated domain-containing protein [Sulfolobus sp. E5-1-F]|uniref:heavy-metal-associated domain-containing protein n=1 Tax=Sulfolobaceae TaxID=118883 RepID=UPI001296EB56|nr:MULTISPECIES: heavy metal-associated domain-containing protein [unclassified Sulfolobus]QGA53120.1 heavy-metal-associated domain-containing protein [Sulfolobus sp. E5-1-F]QGA68241.1 heavy-metal-associated domain-containing protein [Sulfolobus sp. E11-6]